VDKSNVNALEFRARDSLDGRGFNGVQKPRPNGEQLRMLFALESALWPGFGPSHQDLPASRTDAGVSALGQVIVFDAALSVSPPEKGQSIDIETGP
jgi:tRNA U38,U39,U40 pseudouridine synthase TruA